MMDTKRSILWVIFAVSLFFLWDSWQHYKGDASVFFGPATVHHAEATSSAGGAPSDVPLAPTAAPAAGPATAPAAPAAIPGQAGASASTAAIPSVAATPAAAQGQEVKITTDLISVDINTLGAGIDRIELLQHRDTLDPKKNMVLLERTPDHTYIAQTGVALPNDVASVNHHTLFTRLPGPTTFAPGQDQLDVSFSAEAGGLKLVKTFTFKRGSYEIGVKHVVTNVSDHALDPSLYLQLVRDDSKPEGTVRFYSPYYGPALYTQKEHFKKVPFGDVATGKEPEVINSDNGWIGFLQHYFAAVWIPKSGEPRTDIVQQINGTQTYRAAALISLGQLAPGASATNEARLFVGPEEERLLEKVAPGLELTRDYGWFGKIFAGPVFWLLEQLHNLLGNWGWAIIALTVLIKAVFFPLSAASYRSMARMKSVAPRLKALQERYKDDRAKLNQAMMELYKTEKINPAGGCLPILIQIPVFIALYSVLSASVEMRGAPWLGWIHDLAAPDPFYILPGIMMISMFVQYKLNPAPPDPVQAKMMMVMPLVFGVTFFFFPAGLVLYWVVNNLLSIAQQWQITRMTKAATAPS